jgi:spermidine/putrescine transport system substrate-binding protein
VSRLTRRQFLVRSAGAAASFGAASLLASCTGKPPNDLRTEPSLGGEPISSGLRSEAGPLRILNWDQHLWTGALKDFSDTQGSGLGWEYTAFANADEEVQQMRDGGFDVAVVPIEMFSWLVEQGLIQPLNPAYLGNLENVWTEASARLELDTKYGVPYTVAKAGIGWWPDRAGAATIRTLADPYDAFWNEDLRGLAALPDDHRVGIGLGLIRTGVTDLSSADPSLIEAAKAELLSSVATIGFDDPAVWLAWSGDVARAPQHDHVQPRFMFGRRPLIVADVLAIPSSAAHPVLGHRFIEHMLTPSVAYGNSMWLGYRQPVVWTEHGPFPDVEFVERSDLKRGYLLGPLDAGSDALWRAAWDEVRRALA